MERQSEAPAKVWWRGLGCPYPADSAGVEPRRHPVGVRTDSPVRWRYERGRDGSTVEVASIGKEGAAAAS
jgi:hypothetical protein